MAGCTKNAADFWRGKNPPQRFGEIHNCKYRTYVLTYKCGSYGEEKTMEQKKREIVELVETMRADTVWIVWRFIQNLTK